MGVSQLTARFVGAPDTAGRRANDGTCSVEVVGDNDSLALAHALLAGHGSLSAGESKEAKFVLSWGTKGDKPGEFYSPIGIAINKKDEVFVTDLNNARLQKFTAEGEYLGGFDLPRDTPPRKSCHGGRHRRGRRRASLYLSFMDQDKVPVYTESGQLVRRMGQARQGDGEFHQPGGIVLAPGGTVYVADQGNHRIQMFDHGREVPGKWGEHGSGPGQFGGNEPTGSRFGGPHFLARDSKGRIYTTEGTLGRVQQFSAEGKPLVPGATRAASPAGSAP